MHPKTSNQVMEEVKHLEPEIKSKSSK